MRATLNFNLPEEREEFELAQHGSAYSIVLSDLDNFLRNALKYGNLTELEDKIYDDLRNKLHELANDNGVSV
jgi:hypothetical protein